MVSCIIDECDLEAPRADYTSTSFYGQDSAAADTYSEHEPANAAKCICRSGEDDEVGVIRCKTFHRYWQVHAPEVVIMKPCCYVLHIRDRHREVIRVSTTEQETPAAAFELAEHLRHGMRILQ